MKFKRYDLHRKNWTPQTLFFKYAKPYTVLLESARTHPKIGRYSILGLAPKDIFSVQNNQCTFHQSHQTIQWQGNPFDFLNKKMSDWQENETALPPFAGGAIGFFGYEALKWTEPIIFRNKPGLSLPDLLFIFFDWTVVFDHLQDSISIVGLETAQNEMERFLQSLKKTAPYQKPNNTFDCFANEWQSNFSKEAFCDAVKKAQDYIAAGDIFQANLSQRLTRRTTIDSIDLYQTLSQINPSPFAAYLATPHFDIISSSPERLFRLNKGKAETRPIAGTRPRGKTQDADLLLQTELQLNEKERAEHIMLVDLERNDLGKVCSFGTVKVDEFLTLEKYSHVHHLVSNVSGSLSQKKNALDLVKALFPGGTITGTPKVRSMEIIDELETVQRNAYTGSLGYFSYTGQADFNILIRTLIKQKDQLSLHVGAGIVADSIPENEYKETWHKAEALTLALNQAESRRTYGSYSLS